MNKLIEKIEVLEPCKKLCKRLKGMGYILKWRRLDALDYYHEPGDPDLEIWVSFNDIVVIIMCECKQPDGGELRPSQVECRDKYKKFTNVIYIEVRDHMELKKLILSIAENQYFNPESFEKFKEFSI